MAYSSPASVSTATTITSSWGNSVKAAVDFLANPPACRVYNNANQSIPDSTVTPLTFNTERYDTDTMHSTAALTSRITIKTAGLYLITGTIAFAAGGSSGTRLAGIILGGSVKIAEQQAVTNAGVSVNVSTVYKFAVNDYVELYAYQVSAGALNSLAVANICPEFAATWIGLG